MGCILEFLIEFVLESVFEGYVYLMTLIIPKYKFKPWVEVVLKVFIAVFSVALLIAIISGLFMIGDADPEVKSIGKILVFGSFGIIAFHIILTVIVRIFTRNR
ncbi:MAG: hypothetical protein E7539_03630 [Ruminococcaceae bacterium]|nr:hypothetical protein [Oscillospiraceae bacterium]